MQMGFALWHRGQEQGTQTAIEKMQVGNQEEVFGYEGSEALEQASLGKLYNLHSWTFSIAGWTNTQLGWFQSASGLGDLMRYLLFHEFREIKIQTSRPIENSSRKTGISQLQNNTGPACLHIHPAIIQCTVQAEAAMEQIPSMQNQRDKWVHFTSVCCFSWDFIKD